MTQSFNDTQGRLLAWITQALENGGYLTVAILEYIDAVLFPPEPGRLTAFLTDDTDSQRDSLLDLIFYPDQAVQIDLEPLLESARLSARDERQLHDRLMARAIHARINMPDGRPLVSLRVPGFVKSQFLARLNVAWQMDPHVATALHNGLSAAVRPMVKVRLRNAGIGMSAGRRVFLCRFFQRMAEREPDYLACLDLVLSLLQTTDRDVDGCDLLVDHKRSLFRSLQQARRFERLIAQSNMETLMCQGLRATHVSPSVLIHRMRLIDLICVAMFGRTEAIDLPVKEPVRQVSDLDTAEAAIQSLMNP
jgi:hypothetical protein